MPETWLAIYQTEWQSVWALWALPLGFLVYRGVLALRESAPRAGAVPRAARFVDLFALAFAVETLLDPLCTGPLLRALEIDGTTAGSALSFVFVYLGDFRVFLLLFGVAALERGQPLPLARAAGYACIVPLFAGSVYAGAGAIVGEVSIGWLWMTYEAAFLGLILVLYPRIASSLPTAGAHFVRFVGLYVATYYALWLGADLLIRLGDVDAAWALRILPNQLYYAFFVPCIWWRFFRVRSASSE